MATAKDILTLNKSKSILQRIGAMWSSIYCNKSKDKMGLFNHYHGFGSSALVDKLLEKSYNIINKNAKIAVMNDFGLEVISRLIEDGFTDVCILCTEEHDDLYSLIKFMVKREFNFDKIVRLETNMSDKFDLVIANPPYEIGNEVITETMKHCNNAVVLMPGYQYRARNLYNHIRKIEIVDPRNFQDAALSNNLTVGSLTSERQEGSVEDLLYFNLYEERYKEFYRANKLITSEQVTLRVVDADVTPPLEWFMISSRVCDNGVHTSEDCYDYIWNVINDTSILTSVTIDRQTNKRVCGWIPFKTLTEKKNFCDFWYRAELSDKLVRGLHRSNFPVYDALPKIDWSRTDVEYTDEYVLRQLGLVMLSSGHITNISKSGTALVHEGHNTTMNFNENTAENPVGAINNMPYNVVKYES